MTDQRFSLKPFPSDESLDLAITGLIRRNGNKIDITYTISGEIQIINIQGKEDNLARRDNLWKETCLEIFLNPEGSEHYWEVNLSPSGHWNVYRFDEYRKGMKEESDMNDLPVSVERTDAALLLSAHIDMENLISGENPLYVGISSVVKSRKGTISYWALTHPGSEPDFHSRDSFLFRI